jgi:hypothetical protein
MSVSYVEDMKHIEKEDMMKSPRNGGIDIRE